MTTTTEGMDLAALFSPAIRADPYPTYRRWREAAPVSEPVPGILVVSTHEAGSQVLSSPAFGHAEPGQGALGLFGSAQRDNRTGLVDGNGRPVISFLGLNPPDHTRLRRLVSKAFTARTVSTLVPRVEEITAELLDAALDAGETDLITALAEPLPVRVISEARSHCSATRDSSPHCARTRTRPSRSCCATTRRCS